MLKHVGNRYGLRLTICSTRCNTRLRLQGVLGFFGGLSRRDALEIEHIAGGIVYTGEEERAVRLKIDLRILPIIVLSYICLSLCSYFGCLECSLLRLTS